MYTVPADKLKNVIREKYQISPKILDRSGWGYNTVFYYLETPEGQRYSVKIAKYSPEKEVNALRDIYFSNILKEQVPTPQYLKNSDGEFLTRMDQTLLRISKYIEGACPFDMTLDHLAKMAGQLHHVHSFDASLITEPVQKLSGPNTKLLHGDLTPSNVIFAGDRVNGILDFEDVLIGPIEYDLAKSAVFGWFRMAETPFEQVLHTTADSYENGVNKSELYRWSVKHASEYLEHIKTHESSYKDEKNWKDDFAFADFALKTIQDAGAGLAQI